MKIDDKLLNYQISKYIPKSTPNAAGEIEEKKLVDQQKVDGKEQQQQDTIVHLSQASKEAQQIKEIISSEPDIREEKVSALKEKIESGTYQVDHNGVADKLVDDFIDEIF